MSTPHNILLILALFAGMLVPGVAGAQIKTSLEGMPVGQRAQVVSWEGRRAMVRRHHPKLSLSRQCRLLSISRSSLYHTAKGESAQNLGLMRRIDELFLNYPFYGSRQMVRHWWRDGVCVGRHRVRRLMRLMGLQAIYQAPRTTTRHPRTGSTPIF